MKRLAILLCAIGFAIPIFGQNQSQPSPIIFIYDASGSMWGQMQGKTKMEIASEVLETSIENLPENQNIALVAYGHRQKGDCRDVEFLVDISNNSKATVNSEVKKIKPLGMTPLAHSANLVIEKLKSTKTKATIILVTDGIESCNGNICDVVTAAKNTGVDFKLHIIGFGLKDGETKQLKCAANAGDGKYFNAENGADLGDVLEEATNQTIDKKGNFGVYVLKDGKPLDAQVIAYAKGTENIIDRGRTYKDTVYLFLPQATYDLKVHPHGFGAISAVAVNNIQTFNDKTTYRTVSLDGAKLKFLISNNNKLWDSQIGVKTLDGKNVIGGRTYANPKTLDVDAGTYNIELYARNTYGVASTHILENVSVGNGETKEVSYNFNTGITILAGTFNGEPMDVGIGIKDAETGKSVYGGRTYKKNKEVILTSGIYIVSLSEHGVYNKSAKGAEFTIEVKPGETLTVIKELD